MGKLTVRQLRRLADYTQQDMANLMGVDRTTYICIEQGKTRLSFSNAMKIAGIFNKRVDEIDFLCDNAPQNVEV